MVLIKEYEVYAESVKDKKHLSVYECLWIKKLKAINKLEPCGGLLKKQYNKQLYEANKQSILQNQKEYRESNKEAIAQQKKLHYEANKEAIAQQKKQYGQSNKHQIALRKSVKITCECGSTLCKAALSRHKKTTKHQAFIESQLN
jgi:hypothetical protein